MILLNIGFGNFISTKKVISIVNPESSPIKRLAHLAKERNMLIDASCGRKTQSVIVMDSGHVVLSALSCETLFGKTVKNQDEDSTYTSLT